MIPALIFSKDRPMQLDALLRSMAKYAPQLVPRVIDEPASASFRRAVVRALPQSGMVSFFVDDMLFYRPMPEVDFPRGACYSLRLGKNTTWSYYEQRPVKEGKGMFAYAFSLDGHVFHVDDIRHRIEGARFECPNRMEDALAREKGFGVRWGDHSCAVNIPHNRVNGAGKWPKRDMGGSIEDLKLRFSKGERIDFDRMDFSRVNSTHQEIPLVFMPTNGKRPAPVLPAGKEPLSALGCTDVTVGGVSIPGWFHPPNRECLDKLIREHSIRSVIEIGSFLGASTAWFAERAERVACVDTWRETATEGTHNNLVWTCERTGLPREFFGLFEANMKAAGVWNKLQILRGNSSEVHMQAPPADLVYIDGDHSYAGCKADILNYAPKARRIVCGDDYERRPEWGVVRAVDELLPARQVRGGFWWCAP